MSRRHQSMTVEITAVAGTPPAAPPAATTLGGLALDAARHTGVALTGPGGTHDYAEFDRAVREIAAGLAGLGIAPGDRVGILAGTRPEWTLSDFGALCAGAIVVPVYHTSSPEECGYVLGHAEVRVLICEDPGQAAKIAAVRGELPALEHVVLMTGEAPGTIGLPELRARGAGAPHIAEERVAALSPEHPATIVYTSGTTGPPKGCVLTHANLLATVAMYEARLDLRAAVIYLYLPLAHALARVTQIVCIDVGGTLAFWSGDPKAIMDDLGRIRPTHFPSVPRVFEKIHAGVLSDVEEQPALRQALFRRALAVGAHVGPRLRAGDRVGRLERLRHRAVDRLVLSRIRGLFGDRLELGLTGAAPIGRDILEFFAACGVLVLEGYGMTETCAAGTLNTPGELRLGSVGQPLPGTDVAFADDGEILMRGPHVFARYHRNPDATAETVQDGWLRSGDLGVLDSDGYLSITGRKKDLIITSSGKNISPENLESALRERRYIANAVVCGDRRPYLVALLTLDAEELPALAERLGAEADAEALAADPSVRELIQAEVDAVNATVARIEQIKRFTLLPRDLSQAAGELTPTLKVKRPVVQGRYAPQIEALYSVPGARPSRA
jgi:long-chain acyl-CoA synthetase